MSNDEFYTRYEDIQNRLTYYKRYLKNKIVYCNCDDWKKSNFSKYFMNNFQRFELKELIVTGLKDKTGDSPHSEDNVTNTIKLDTVKKAEHLYEKIYSYNVLLHQDRSVSGDVKYERFERFKEWIMFTYPDGNGKGIRKEMLMNKFNEYQGYKGFRFSSTRDMAPAIKDLIKLGMITVDRKNSTRTPMVKINKQEETK